MALSLAERSRDFVERCRKSWRGRNRNLGDLMQELACDIHHELTALDERISSYNRRIREPISEQTRCVSASGRSKELVRSRPPRWSRRLEISPALRMGASSRHGWDLVPKQKSSGGKSRLFGISKRGDRYLRTLLIHGARAVLGKAGGKQDARSVWINRNA